MAKSNEALEENMKALDQKIDRVEVNVKEAIAEKAEDLKEELLAIKEQTTKTNGRVTSLEQWKWMAVGAISILTALVLPIIFILIKNLKP